MLTEGLNGEPFPANCVANICGGQPLRTSKVFVVKSCPSIPTLLKYFLCGQTTVTRFAKTVFLVNACFDTVDGVLMKKESSVNLSATATVATGKQTTTLHTVSVGIHTGNLNGGHYFTVETSPEGKFYKNNDSRISELGVDSWDSASGAIHSLASCNPVIALVVLSQTNLEPSRIELNPVLVQDAKTWAPGCILDYNGKAYQIKRRPCRWDRAPPRVRTGGWVNCGQCLGPTSTNAMVGVVFVC